MGQISFYHIKICSHRSKTTKNTKLRSKKQLDKDNYNNSISNNNSSNNHNKINQMRDKTVIDLLASLKEKPIIMVSRNHRLRESSKSIKIRIQNNGKDKMSERNRRREEGQII